MAGDTDNPRIWLLGDVFVAPVGTTAPTTVSAALDDAFDALGLLSEDGLTESRDEDSTDHYAWGSILIRTVRSKHKRTFKVTALEDNPVVFDLVNPGSTATTASGVTTRTVKVPTSNPKAFVIQTKDGAVTRRRAIAKGEVTEVGDIVSAEGDIEGKELTITVYPSSAGVLYTDITDDAQAAVS